MAKAYTEVRGHGLQSEGLPYDLDRHRIDERTGHGLCSCGVYSPVLASNSQRQKWHRGHKTEIQQKANTDEKKGG